MQSDLNKQKLLLDAQAILKYLITSNDAMDTLIMCTPGNVELFTFDQYLYEALGSIKPHDIWQFAKLKKFLENVEVHSYSKNMQKSRTILKYKMVEELRKKALQ